MTVFPSFREAVSAGLADPHAPLSVALVRNYEPRPADAYLATAARFFVAGPVSLEGQWQGGGEDEDGALRPEVFLADPVVFADVDVMAEGAVVFSGEALVGYEPFGAVKVCSGGDFVLTWPKGVLVLS